MAAEYYQLCNQMEGRHNSSLQNLRKFYLPNASNVQAMNAEI